MAKEWYAKADAQKKGAMNEQRKEADQWITLNCNGVIYDFRQLLVENPYDIGGECYFLETFPGSNIQILSRTVALIMYRDQVVYTDFGQTSAPGPGQWRSFVVKGDSQPYKYTSTLGSAVTAVKVNVLKEASTER
jgi:hypothetical protein